MLIVYFIAATVIDCLINMVLFCWWSHHICEFMYLMFLGVGHFTKETWMIV